MPLAQRTDPDLWDQVKTELQRSDKGGDPGAWSRSKARLAALEYKKRGGGYEGRQSNDNDRESAPALAAAPPKTATKKALLQSAAEMGLRCDPRMSKAEIATAIEAANARDDALTQMHRKDLLQSARILSVAGRSKMAKPQLLAAVGTALGATDAATLSKAELASIASALNIAGRSKMSKPDLYKAAVTIAR
ncbi:MAG: hypothetical protein AAGD34_11950 [Pseudomonadota bacterium]